MVGNSNNIAQNYVYNESKGVLREILTHQQKAQLKLRLQKHYDSEAKLYHCAPEELKAAIQKEIDDFLHALN